MSFSLMCVLIGLLELGERRRVAAGMPTFADSFGYSSGCEWGCLDEQHSSSIMLVGTGERTQVAA